MLNYLKQAFPELISRFVIGFVFIESGLGKFNNLNKVITYFESLQIPLAKLQAPLVAGVELGAGLLISVGLMTRLSTVPLVGIMIVALITAKKEDLTSLSSLVGITEFLYIVILIWLFIHGSKYISVDALLGRNKK